MRFILKMARTMLVVAVLLMISCSGTKDLEKASPSLKFYAGATHGGIIENTELDIIQPISPDAYSGATRMGVHAGMHYEYPLKRTSLETGVDLFVNGQTFTYEDYFPSFSGTRDLLTTQIRVPLAVNFRFFRGVAEDGMLQLKLGLTTGYVFFGVEDQGQVPSYKNFGFSMGPLLGADFIPFRFGNGSSLGLSAELSRSFQKVYDDFYQLGDEPGVSYLKFGLVYRLKKH